jgi:hypothetical protein
MEVNGHLHIPAALPLGEIAPSTHWIGGRVALPQVSLDAEEKRKIFHCRELNSAIQPIPTEISQLFALLTAFLCMMSFICLFV